ncbi:hypothetical protein M8J76_004321 [Diaphorina citri]|nr:hypothetical protein M8J76_004321 [Diaphorina citri]
MATPVTPGDRIPNHHLPSYLNASTLPNTYPYYDDQRTGPVGTISGSCFERKENTAVPMQHLETKPTPTNPQVSSP